MCRCAESIITTGDLKAMNNRIRRSALKREYGNVADIENKGRGRK